MHYCKGLSLIVCIEVVVFFYLIVIKANPLKLLHWRRGWDPLDKWELSKKDKRSGNSMSKG